MFIEHDWLVVVDEPVVHMDGIPLNASRLHSRTVGC